MSETTRIAELEAIARSDDFGRDNTGAEWVRGPDGARWYVAGVHGLLLEAVDTLATRERELAEARADLAAVEAVERFRKRQDAGVMITALRLSAWTDADGKLAEAPTLVALGRALLVDLDEVRDAG